MKTEKKKKDCNLVNNAVPILTCSVDHCITVIYDVNIRDIRGNPELFL